MLRKTPPLAAAEAFLAAAGARSFRAAAEELALSPSAFSRRIQMLERFIDTPLFDRSGPAVVLTEKGRIYRDAIEPALQVIRDATANMKQADVAHPLRVSASQSFAIDWLMPRLARLREQADVCVELVVATGVQSLRGGEADVAIVGGTVTPADYPSDRLVALEGVVVAAPTLSNGHMRPSCVADLENYDLLAMKTPDHLWRYWLDEAGYSGPPPRPAAKFDTIHVMYEAAANGMGLALAIPLVSERYLRDGRLTACTPVRQPIGLDYRLVYRTTEVSRRSHVGRFRHWLHDEISASCVHFQEITRGPQPLSSLLS